jgi:hypothetical protein
MRRDMNLVRKVLLAVEAGNQLDPIEGCSEDEVKYHKKLVIDAGLAEGTAKKDSTKATDIPAAVIIRSLTWAGHDFVDAIGDESRWAKVKAFLADAGKQVTIETVKVAVTQLFGFSTT